MIYLYGVIEPGASAPETTGLDGQPLEVVPAGQVAGLTSRHEGSAFTPAPEALWAHDRVLEAAMGCGPVLPARFASTFPDPGGLVESLQREGADLRRRLDDVRGCVELAVRLLLPASDCSLPGDGRGYLNARLLQRQESRRAIEQTLEPLSKHAVKSHRSPIGGDSGTLSASYLVRVGEVEDFAERVRRLSEHHAELSLSCTGPWPPYSFVGQAAG